MSWNCGGSKIASGSKDNQDNHDGSKIATRSEDDTIKIWDAATGKVVNI